MPLFSGHLGILPAELHTMQPGDDIKVMAPLSDFLVLDEVPDSRNLWLLATGTPVGPFLSILSGAEPWQRFDKITQVYEVRYVDDLAYVNNIQHWLQQYPQRFSFIPVVSREPMPGGVFRRRIPAVTKRAHTNSDLSKVYIPQTVR
ncbi:MAG: ferredoxin--NADP+ reductase [Paraglaciecola sp.]